MDAVFSFFDHPFFTIIGGIATIISVLAILALTIAWVFGIAPIAWKLGLSRWRRKIGVAADADNWHLIKKDLVNSRVFREKNIEHISAGNLASVRNYSLILVHYTSFNQDQFMEILRTKRSEAGMIVYYPEFQQNDEQRIPSDTMKRINERENTTVVNFRGRLLNDLVTTFITTSLVNNA